MTAPLRLLTRFRRAARAFALVAALAVTALLAGPASANAVEEYHAANDALETLLTQRDSLEASIASAMAAERAFLQRLVDAEGTLERLIEDRRANEARRTGALARLAEAEAQVPALDEQATLLERRIEAQERWLLDGEAPRATSMRGYRAALASRDQLSGDREAALQAMSAIRHEEALAVLDLGRLNTEVTFWERQADALSRQVGSSRATALGATARLLDVEKNGTELASKIQDQVRALRERGHPVGAALVAEGPAPLPQPLTWPTAAPRGYVLPTGPSALPMRAGPPLPLEQSQLPVPIKASQADPWLLPVRGIITTTFGDGTPYQPAHWAIDVGARLYEPVRAASDGIVEFAGLAVGDNRYASYGMVVVVRHEGGLTSLYAHLDDRAYGAPLKPGDAVKKGQILGYVGLTGNTTGPHVHFEVRLEGQPVDPLLLVNP